MKSVLRFTFLNISFEIFAVPPHPLAISFYKAAHSKVRRTHTYLFLSLDICIKRRFVKTSSVCFSLCLCSILIMLPVHISAPEHSASLCLYPQLLVWFVAFESLMPHVELNVESSQSVYQSPLSPTPLPLGFVTLTTGRGSVGALSLTVIINNLDPQKWATRLLDALSGLKRLDAISVASIHPLVCYSEPSAYPIHSVQVIGSLRL